MRARNDDEYASVYRFGPLERRGLVGSWRAGQVLIVGLACCVAVMVFRTLPTSAGFVLGVVLITAGVGLTAVPVAGRSVEQWAPLLADWLVQRVRGTHRYRALEPFAGAGSGDQPPALAGCSVLAVPLEGGRELGVVWDRDLRAYTAVLVIEMRGLGLLAADEQERRLESWGRVLASLASDRGCVRRVQLLERTVPCDADLLAGYLDESGSTDVEVAYASYSGLLANATQVTQEHELLLSLQVDERKAWRMAGQDPQARGLTREAQASAVLLREVQALAHRMEASELTVLGLLSPDQLTSAIRSGYDPYRQPRPLASRSGPVAADITWSSYRADASLHRTYWVAEWPRLGVGPTFFSPLLLGLQAVRSVSVVLEPVAPSRSRAAVEAAITSDEADEQVRAERGFRATARRRRQAESAERREQELADGYEEMRFVGFVTVSGRDDGELAAACAEVEHAAQRAYLTLEPLWGQQEVGLTFGALPLARGLRSVPAWSVAG